MKVLVVIALFSIIAYASSAAVIIPVYDGAIEEKTDKKVDLGDVDTDAGLPIATGLPPIRHRRITCDLLSLGTKYGSISKIACPARCLAQGRKGGSCVDGVCVCH